MTRRHLPKKLGAVLRSERGAALLLAMIVLTLVSTVAAGMVWQQSRAIQIEAAERARAQAGWMLNSGIDFAREVVRRYGNSNPQTDQPWDSELAETRLSALLAADQDNNADASLEAFISGRVNDAQARYNLFNLIGADGKPIEKEVKTLRRLCEAIGLNGTADLLIVAYQQARTASGNDSNTSAALLPGRVDQLRWLGLDAATVARLADFVTLLPEATPINLNTASAEVIYAVIDDLDRASAARLVRQRNNRFKDIDEARAQVAEPLRANLDAQRTDVKSRFYEVNATVRYEDRAITEYALLQRGAAGASEVTVVRHERRPRAVGG
jgi:general secretion pathway protein K